MGISNSIPSQFMSNDAYLSILSRVSVRRYSDLPVSDHAPMDKWHPDRIHLNRLP